MKSPLTTDLTPEQASLSLSFSQELPTGLADRLRSWIERSLAAVPQALEARS